MVAKRITATLVATVILLGCFFCAASAEENTNDTVWAFAGGVDYINEEEGIQASGLIYRTLLQVSKKNNTTITINGVTDCDPVVIKCGFKNIVVQRRLSTSTTWTDYHNFGNDYVDTFFHAISKDLTVDPGYLYRAICKHYAKKNALTIQTISATSNYVAI